MFQIPDWAYEFHGHQCPFMPIGYRMGTIAMRELGVGRSLNHEMRVFSEMGDGHPQGCMQDGIQSATAATFGKGQMQKLYFGKVAAIFFWPGKGAVRIALRPEFVDKLSPHEFFQYRRKGVEPSDIPPQVSEDIIRMVLTASEEELFSVKKLSDFTYQPIPGSFNKDKCEVCGEYVFERYLRLRDGIKICIPCAGADKEEKIVSLR
ncbi:MAG: FmdE family protein [Calditrichia bacterium]